VHVAYGRGSALLLQNDKIPREGVILGVFLPIDNNVMQQNGSFTTPSMRK